MKGQEEGDMSGNGNRELNEYATVLSITYSSLTSRVATPTVPSPIKRYASGRCAMALGAYRGAGLMARVVQ
jgi:hypothetical protein